MSLMDPLRMNSIGVGSVFDSSSSDLVMEEVGEEMTGVGFWDILSRAFPNIRAGFGLLGGFGISTS